MPLVRRELRLGFALGGLLMAVGVCYLLVVTLFGGKGGDELALPDPLGDPAEVLRKADADEPPVDSPRESRVQADGPAPDPQAAWANSLGFNGVPPRVTQNPTYAGPHPVALATEPVADEPDHTELDAPDLNLSETLRQALAEAPGGDWAGALGTQESAPEPTRHPASPPVASAADTREATTHTVEPGDTFATVAERYLGDAGLFGRIAATNPDVDPRRLRIGQTLHIPAAGPAPAEATAPTQTPPPASTGTTHVVAAGETLSSIAASRLGRANLWQQVYDLNRDLIGPDPAALRVGMTLRLPRD